MTTSKIGKTVLIRGKILETLKYGGKEWFDIQLENGCKITVNVNMCKIEEEVAEEDNEKH